jgi:ketosteroid isomerase-like protein
MTKWTLVLLSGFAVAAAQSGPNVTSAPSQAKAEPAQAPNVNKAASQTMEVLAASDAWRQAMMKKDAAGLRKLLHEDLIYSHSNARSQTKAEVIQATTTGKTTIEAIDFSDVTVRVIGTAALIRANVEMRNNADGKSTTNHLNVLHVWLKGPGGWQLVGRQATLVSPPTTP